MERDDKRADSWQGEGGKVTEERKRYLPVKGGNREEERGFRKGKQDSTKT